MWWQVGGLCTPSVPPPTGTEGAVPGSWPAQGCSAKGKDVSDGDKDEDKLRTTLFAGGDCHSPVWRCMASGAQRQLGCRRPVGAAGLGWSSSPISLPASEAERPGGSPMLPRGVPWMSHWQGSQELRHTPSRQASRQQPSPLSRCPVLCSQGEDEGVTLGGAAAGLGGLPLKEEGQQALEAFSGASGRAAGAQCQE